MFSYHFGIFYWTNLLTRCPVLVSVYYICRCIPEKVQNPKCSEKSEKIIEILIRQKSPGARRTSPGGAHSPQEAPGLAAHEAHLVASCTTSRHLFAYIFAPDLKMRDHRRFFAETHLSSATTKNPNSGDRSSCSGTLPGLAIAPGVIFIAVAASHDEEGVVLHRG